jgi:hypothetical protein
MEFLRKGMIWKEDNIRISLYSIVHSFNAKVNELAPENVTIEKHVEHLF